MRAIVVDDEQWMLRQFEDECQSISEFELVGSFLTPAAALDYARGNRVDLAFLDIEMPGMNGLELSDRLRAYYPNIIVIFISAYDDYMPDAFCKRKADYFLVKPYTTDEIHAVFDRAVLLSARLKKRVKIHTFGFFEVYVDDQPLQFSSPKAKEALAVLVDRHGESVSTEEAFRLMWEDKAYDHTQASAYRRALSKLHSTLQSAGIEQILRCFPYGRSLNCDMVECDYLDFLNGKVSALRDYKGKYMLNYSWAESTMATLNRKKLQFDPSCEDDLYDE